MITKSSTKLFWELSSVILSEPENYRCSTEGQNFHKILAPVGNFRPGASFSQNTFSGHATDFLSDVLRWGKNHPYWKICREIDVNLSFWCSFDYFDTFPNIVQVIWIKVWMAVTKLTHSKQKVDVCRLVWFSVRSLLCKSFWADSGDFQAETKMRRSLGKVGRVFVRVKKTIFWENSSDFPWEA